VRNVATEPLVAFATQSEPPALEIRINFGVFAGRDATPAELDELAAELLPDVGEVSIVAEVRHEVSEETEVALHQVRVEVAAEQLPDYELDREELTKRLVATCERWANACVADRHVEIGEF
jgi:hypothetical protein